MDLDTALLRGFAVLADELHFGRAAARLGITQQALSKRVQRLELQLGRRLIDRTDRRAIRPTAEGFRLLESAREVLAAVDRIVPVDAVADRIRVDVMGDDLAPVGWLHRAARATSLPLEAIQRPADATADHLVRTGGARLGFGRAGAVPAPWPERLQRRLVLLEPLAVLLPADHPSAASDGLPLAALRGHPLWFPMTAAPIEWRGYVAELAERFELDIDTTGSTFGYRRWGEDVVAGVMPPSIIGEAMAPPDPRMRSVPLVDPTPVFPWWVLWRDDTVEETVSEVLGAMGFGAGAPSTPPGVWLPASDAALLADRGDRPLRLG